MVPGVRVELTISKELVLKTSVFAISPAGDVLTLNDLRINWSRMEVMISQPSHYTRAALPIELIRQNGAVYWSLPSISPEQCAHRFGCLLSFRHGIKLEEGWSL